MEPHSTMAATAAIGSIGGAFYFVPETIDKGIALGLSGLRFYFYGRGGVLGDVEAEVVRSAFGYFHPDLAAKLWNSSRTVMPPRAAARAHIECAHDFGRRRFAAIDATVLGAFSEAAEQLIAFPEGASLPLFAGYRAEPSPDADDPAARAMHTAMVLREMRGAFHLLALTAVGLDTGTAHAVNRPNDIEMFGWEPSKTATAAERDQWQKAEDLTNDLLAPAYAALDDAATEALIAGTNAMAEALADG